MEASQKQDSWHEQEVQYREKDFPYFRRLWRSIVVALLAASFLPMIVIGGGMYYYTLSVIREKTLDSLIQEVSDHREAIDEFLDERTLDLKLLASNLGLYRLTAPGALKEVFDSLQEQVPCFTDLGIIDDGGRHLAYVGPYDLLGKNYRDSPWFKITNERGLHISDVFTGFREVPHFVIAVKQITGGKSWIIRATVDTAHFERLVTEILTRRSGDAFLVNREGVFQTSPRTGGRLMEPSGIRGLEPFDHVKVQEQGGQILATAWLHKAPWAVVAKFDPEEIYRTLRNVRYLAFCVFALGGIIIVWTVLRSTNYLIARLEKKRRSIRVLDRELQLSSKVSSSVHLASGIVQEMNENLSNVDLVTTWLQDLLQGDLTREENLQEMSESLTQIKQEVQRARSSTEKFSRLLRHDLPVIREISPNPLLEEILDLFGREIRMNNISVHRDFQDPLPPIRSDPSTLRQVFQTLMLEAMRAVGRDGRIAVKTRTVHEGITVEVAGTGAGMPAETTIDPLHTAGEGLGLELSMASDMVRKLGGRLSVDRQEGKGAVFKVELPSRFEPAKT